VLVAADAAAELVEVGEAEIFGFVDEHGVGVGDIDAGLDDGGGDEDVGLVADELVHDGFELVLVHLAVADDDAGVGDHLADLVGDGFDVVDLVVDEEDLAVAGELALQGLLDARLVVGDDLGDDAAAVGGGRGEVADVADAQERHVEGARDGGGGHGEDVDGEAEFFEAFLVFDAEALFLVDDDEAEVGEDDVFGEEAVGADEDVDLSGAGALEDFFHLLGGFEAGD
jgi:hypothetical protein